MGAFLERIGLFARSPDARPLAEIAADIDAELEFHVAESARALEREGLAPELARAEALKRFGDYGRIRRECARTQMGERIMLQRIQLVLTAVLVVAVGLMLWSTRESQAQARAALAAERAATTAALARLEASLTASSPSKRATQPVDDDLGDAATPPRGEYVDSAGRATDLDWAASSWKDEFQLEDKVWRHGLKVAERLSALPGAQGAEILARIWPHLSVEHREQVLKPFVFGGGHPYALEVLELGLDDAAPSVHERACLYVQTYSWMDLRMGDGLATSWLAAWRDKPVAEVLRENARRWAGDVQTLRAEYENGLARQLGLDLLVVVDEIRPETFAKAGVDLGAILREAGLADIPDVEVAGISATAARARAEKVRAWARAK